MRDPLVRIISPIDLFHDLSILYRRNTPITPDSPSAQVSRASEKVGATIAQRVIGWRIASHANHSAAVRVLPAPRPAMYSQMFQSFSGGNCSDLASSRLHLYRAALIHLVEKFDNSFDVSVNVSVTVICNHLRLYSLWCV